MQKERSNNSEIIPFETLGIDRLAESILQTSLDGFCVFDLDGRIRYTNQALSEISGYSENELLKMKIKDFEVRESPEQIVRHIEKTKQQGYDRFETQHRRKDGSVIDIEVNTHFCDFRKYKFFFCFFRDITEQKRIAEQLTESEKRYRTLFNHAPVTLLLMDSETGKAINANNMALEFSGRSKEQFKSITAADLSTPLQPDGTPSAQKAKELLARAAKGEELDFEWTFTDPDGEQRIGLVHLIPFKSENRNLVLLASEEITDLKNITRRLQLSENKYKMLVESAQQVICTIDENGTFLFINKFGAEGLGAKPEELIGRSMWELFPNNIADENVQFVTNAITADIHVCREYETEVFGEQRCYLVHIWPLPQDNTGIKSALVFANNITAQKKTQQALRESEQRWRSLAENVPAFVTVADRSGRILSINRVLPEFTAEQVVGSFVWDYAAAEYRRLVKENVENVFKTGQTVTFENQGIGPGGEFVWYGSYLAPIYKQKQIDKIIYISQDISERKRIRQELEAYKEKIYNAQKQAYIGSASAILAHDINQPLTVINLLLGKALELLKTESCRPEVIKKVKESLLESRKAASLTRTFRKYIRDSAFEITDTVNLEALVKKIISMLADRAESAKMDITIKGFENLPDISFNEISLQQVFLILIQNAIDAAEDRKESTLEIAAKAVDNNIELTFSDNCGGIAPENLEKIFEPFYTTKADKGRLGLGLEIVNQILMGCLGEIRVQSELGKGTAFYITLPVHNM